MTNGNGGPATMQDQDTFPVKIQGAGVESFEMQAHTSWLVQDALLAVLARDEVSPRSSLTLSLSGTVLDPLAELQSLKGFKPGTVLRLVEEPYSPRSAKAHMGRVLELLRASGPQDALREGHSISILETLTHSHTPESPIQVNGKSLKRSSSNSKAESANQEAVLPEYLLPGSSERPIMALLPHSSQPEVPSCMQDMTLSCWNPPPGHRKLQGDFLYITVITLEGRRCDITSCPRGFYQNRSTVEVFDPRPVQSTPVFHSLMDLLCHISTGFKEALATLRNRSQLPPVEVMPTPYRTLCWLGPSCASRTHKNAFSRLGLEDHGAAHSPDWNEETQIARDLPQGSLEQRLQRDRALLQVNSAFVWAVAQGAESVIDGFVEPISGGLDDPAFMWGGLFMSQGAPGAVAGGERGRRAVQRLELRGVQAYSDLEGVLQGLHTLPTATVDYRGVRLSAQGLAPGLEDPEQPKGASGRGLLYGLAAGLLESPHRRKLLELLAQAAKALCVQRHVVLSPSGHQVPLFTSADAQGLLGADGRFYLLDLFRSFPADANFRPPAEMEGEKSPVEEEATEAETTEVAAKEGEKMESCAEEVGWPENYHADTGLPRSFPQGLCRLRPELMQAFIQHKHAQFTKRAKERMEENGGIEECVMAADSRGTDAVRGACKDVGSVSDIIFEMRFNPNIFTPGVSFPSCDSESTRLQERLQREAAALIVTQQIPAFLECCLKDYEAPIDSATLKLALHHRGINLRYLGHVAKAISQSEHKEQLRHIMRLVLGDIVVRSARRIFNNFLQTVETSSLSAAVSHFLCCLLVPHFNGNPAGEDAKKKSRRRGRGSAAAESTPWSMLTGAELWSLIGQDAVETYGITESLGSSPNHLVEHHRLQKLSLLREFSLKTGLQLRLRDYILDNQTKAPIGPDDVLNIFPVVKHVSISTHDALISFRSGQSFLQKGLLEQAHDRLKEAAYLFNRVCDDLQPQACYCLSVLAKVAYLRGYPLEARSIQLKAVVVSERVLGFDHPNTILQYTLLAVYLYSGGENALAQKCLLRARHLLLTVHGEDHPYTATLDTCLGLLLTGEQAGKFLQSALRLNTSFFGPADLRTALSQHLLSQWMCCKGDFRAAMSHEKEAFSAFTNLFGEDHPQTRCSSEFLGSITQQAVRVERSLRQSGADTQAPEGLTPSTETVLEQLVLVTGIRKNSHSDRLLEFKQKLLEQRAAEQASTTATATASSATEGGGEGAEGEEKAVESGEGGSAEKAAGVNGHAQGLGGPGSLEEGAATGTAAGGVRDQAAALAEKPSGAAEGKSEPAGADPVVASTNGALSGTAPATGDGVVAADGTAGVRIVVTGTGAGEATANGAAAE
ncbi:clustered mitochondria protein homolog [Aplochiton taeniatus]